jgi:hypothetical protein
MRTINPTEWKARVDRYLEGLTAVSSGACPGCDSCGLAADASDEELDEAGEPGFSWSPCECCGSLLGGDRHPAHGVSEKHGILHLGVCTDCLFYVNYGDVPTE